MYIIKASADRSQSAFKPLEINDVSKRDPPFPVAKGALIAQRQAGSRVVLALETG